MEKTQSYKYCEWSFTGTVLDLVLLNIFIYDLEKRIKHSNFSFFADDTRVSKHISHQIECLELQEDLNAIFQSSRENDVKLHEDRFELSAARDNPKSLIHELPFSMETCPYQASEYQNGDRVAMKQYEQLMYMVLG